MYGLRPYVDFEDGKIITGSTQDVTPILEDAKNRHKAGAHGSSDFKHAARIPKNIIESYINTNGVSYADVMSDPVHFKRMLNDPALSGFRIWPGRV